MYPSLFILCFLIRQKDILLKGSNKSSSKINIAATFSFCEVDRLCSFETLTDVCFSRMPFLFQGSKSYDVAVDPHMLDFHSQIEDIEIQGKPWFNTAAGF